MKNTLCSFFLLFAWMPATLAQQAAELPDTGISGIYEAVQAVEDAEYALRYWAEFGFRPIDSAALSEAEALRLYGVPSALKAYRLQNGPVDCHGLLRLWVWEKPLGPGLGYGPPETIGSRMAVMMTADIMRLHDVFEAARDNGMKVLSTEPIADDLFGLNKEQKNDLFKRPVLVRENAVYGEFINHVFFQRYGYAIPGYGYINPDAPLKTSEFTHHDWIIQAESMEAVSYLSTALGLRAEGPPTISGDWQKGPRRVFVMAPGYSHWYQGFVSPNNICGKLKFFIPRTPKPDRSEHQRLGELGLTLHTFYTPRLEQVYELVKKDARLKASPLAKNEFGERCFNFSDQVGITWQVIEKAATNFQPVKELKFELINN